VAAWERGDFSSAEWAHPEIEYVHADGLEPASWKGLAGLAEGTRAWVSAWERLDLEQTRAKAAELFHVRSGKVTRLVLYWDRERAFADLGLALETGSPTS
jgi:hypothetical protein